MSATRPRLTLADIVASPPDGWEAEMWQRGITRFRWRPKYEMPDGALSHGACVIWHRTGLPTEAIGARETERAAAHRAVADLLVLLGEVES